MTMVMAAPEKMKRKEVREWAYNQNNEKRKGTQKKGSGDCFDRVCVVDGPPTLSNTHQGMYGEVMR